MEIYKNANFPINKRVENLLSIMTLKEKVGQLNQKMYGWQALEYNNGKFIVTQKFEDEVSIGDGLGALYGLFRADPWSGVNCSNAIPLKDCAKAANTLQKYVLENTRLGIPIMFSEECPHGHQAIDSTIFPTNIAVGSSFNEALYEKAFSKVAEQMRAKGATLALISCLDIAQDPRWGRTEECFGEDPYLAQVLTNAVVKGLQGEDESQLASNKKLGAVVKHFCAQGAAIGGHNGRHTVIGQREMREIHLLPMVGAIKANALACMAAYNDIDGVYCHGNKHLLTNILRDELGFNGFVMSDGCAIDILKNVTGSLEGAASMAINAGVDLNLWSEAFTRLEGVVTNGDVSMQTIDNAVGRILTAKFKLGLFEQPYADENAVNDVMQDEEIEQINLQMANESAVLLKNNGILPLKNVKKIAVIGPNADNIYNQLGDYTPEQRADKNNTIKKGLELIFNDCIITYAKGCEVRGDDDSGFAKAVETARNADVVIMALGGSSARESDANAITGAAVAANLKYMNCGEGADKADLFLEPIQRKLFNAVKQVNQSIVTVLVQGRPHALGEIYEQSEAVLIGWYMGTQGGISVAQILKGSVNPSGKLSISIPKSSTHLPVYYNYKTVDDYVDEQGKAEFSFGFGLSYSQFGFSNVKLNRKSISIRELMDGETIEASVSIKNVSNTDGKEVVQCYIHAMTSSVTRRNKELKGFKKVFITKEKSINVTIPLDKNDFLVYSYNNKYELEPGNIEIFMGNSSQTKNMAILSITK